MLAAEFDQWLTQPDRRPLVMGVLNVTPDSFSDGGRYATVDAAADRAREMVAAGADLIDLGGESTRPGSEPVAAAEQIRRVIPVLHACRDLATTFSIDTMSAEVAAAAIDAGAALVNDVSAGRQDDPAMAALVAARGCPVILMHMLGTVQTMQQDPKYENVVLDVREFLRDAARRFEAAGVRSGRVLVDPGYGFGKNFDHNLTLLRGLGRLVADGRPVLVGVSRKSFIGRLSGRTVPAERMMGTAAAVAWCVTQGAAIVRVHDVAAMLDVVKVAAALRDPQPTTIRA